MKIAFIGGGTMGEAILSALLEKKRAIPVGICVSDISPGRREYLSKQYGVITTEDNRDAAAGKDIIILAVKPQQLPDVINGLNGTLVETQVVISIVAGVKISTITERLGHRCIVRAMPNTPAQIGLGVTGWTATDDVTEAQRDKARIILGSMGKEIFFADEGALDMVTAVSGSGPAYVFLFVEALTIGAEKLGLSPEDARELVLRTLLGAAHLLET
ncbi:MAG: pyrroline-5-carboxylate reductase, partial [Dehalococcoidales bacterium]|nr:pyrroline-5-carboxylate reductase [Dehalococcoidales bacterium]